MWLVPWSHTKKRAEDYDDMMYLARQATESIKKVHGSHYQLGTSPSLLYATSGMYTTFTVFIYDIRYNNYSQWSNKLRFVFYIYNLILSNS